MSWGVLVVEKWGAHISLLGISDFAGQRSTRRPLPAFSSREESEKNIYVQSCKVKSEMLWCILDRDGSAEAGGVMSTLEVGRQLTSSNACE
jgi:hypothetical protein